MNSYLSENRRIETKTANLYGDLFSSITDGDFFQKAKSYIKRIKIEKDWFEGKVCLDAGCGVALAAYGLAKMEKTKTYAFDTSPICLKVAKKRLKYLNNLFLTRASCELIPFKSESFDFINCNSILHHLLNIESALNELFRILKPGGFLFIGIYGRGGLLNEYKIKFYRILAKIIPYHLMSFLLWSKNKNEWLYNLYAPLRKSFSERAMRQMLLSSGFSKAERIAEDFYRIPKNLWEKIVIGPDGMYLHFLAEKKV